MSWESKKVYSMCLVALVIGFGLGFAVDRYMFAPEQFETITFEGWGGTFGEVDLEFAAKFKEQYGHAVVVQYHAGASSTVVPKIAAAWPKVTIDATNVAPGVAFELADAGYLVELTPEKVPVMNEIPESHHIKYKDKVIGLGLYSISHTAIAWRTDIIKEPITKWADLFKPEYKGLIATSYMPLGTGTVLVDTAIQWGGSEKNTEPGWEKLKDLAPQIGGVWTTEAESMSFISSGDYPISLWITAGKVFRLGHEQGVPLDWRPFFEDTPVQAIVVSVDCMVVLDGPLQETALKWMNFYLNAENNEYMDGRLGYPPSNMHANINPDMAPWVPSPEQFATYGRPIDFVTRAENIDEWSTRWDQEVAPLLGTGKSLASQSVQTSILAKLSGHRIALLVGIENSDKKIALK